jgi:hypothetical protein
MSYGARARDPKRRKTSRRTRRHPAGKGHVGRRTSLAPDRRPTMATRLRHPTVSQTRHPKRIRQLCALVRKRQCYQGRSNRAAFGMRAGGSHFTIVIPLIEGESTGSTRGRLARRRCHSPEFGITRQPLCKPLLIVRDVGKRKAGARCRGEGREGSGGSRLDDDLIVSSGWARAHTPNR